MAQQTPMGGCTICWKPLETPECERAALEPVILPLSHIGHVGSLSHIGHVRCLSHIGQVPPSHRIEDRMHRCRFDSGESSPHARQLSF